MQRCIGADVPHGALLPRRGVKDLHGWIEDGPLPMGVEASPPEPVPCRGAVAGHVREDHILEQIRWLVGLDRRPSDPFDEQAARVQCLIADHLRREAQAWSPREQPVLGIARLGRLPGVLPVGCTRDDRLEEMLDRPATTWLPSPFHPFDRQPIEQLRMRGPFPLQPEVLDRFDDSGSEEGLPEPVDGDARRQWILPADQPLRQLQPVGGSLFRCPLGQDGRDPSLDPFCRLIVGASPQTECWSRLRQLLHDHHRRKL